MRSTAAGGRRRSLVWWATRLSAKSRWLVPTLHTSPWVTASASAPTCGCARTRTTLARVSTVPPVRTPTAAALWGRTASSTRTAPPPTAATPICAFGVAPGVQDPDDIPSDAAAPLLCAGATVFTPLKAHWVKRGDRVGVIGIGGLGYLAIQFIRALGAVPIAFSRSASKEQEVLALGAHEFFNLSDPEHATRAAGSVDLLLITADATEMPYDLCLSLVRSRGTCAMLGVPNDAVAFSPLGFVVRGINFAGSSVGSIADIKDMLALASAENVRPIVQKLPMSRVNEGLQMVRDGKARYRVVLEN